VQAAIAGAVKVHVGVIFHYHSASAADDEFTVIASDETRPKVLAAIDTLNAAGDATDEHLDDQHAAPVENCPVCVGVCPSHIDTPSPICGVCAAVGAAVSSS
jgi:hypothetical protein